MYLWVFFFFFLTLKNILIQPVWVAEVLLFSMETNSQDLDLNCLLKYFFQESEEFLSSLVVNKTIYAKVDRLAGIINFQRPKDPNDLLNDWSHKLNSLMSLVNKTTHLIAKEEMIHNLQWNKNSVLFFCFGLFVVFPSVGMFWIYSILADCGWSIIPMSYNWRKICSTYTASQLCSFFYCLVKHWQ